MKVHVLGYWGTYPGAGEATTGFLVETDEARILLDCGSGVLAQLYHICPVADLTAVVVTHHHHDHNADLGVLSYAVLLSRLRQERAGALPVYMPEGPDHLVQDLKNEPFINLHHITEEHELDIAGVRVTFRKTIHPVYCLAVRMEKDGKAFTFSADSSVSPQLADLAQGSDLFICEASMYSGMEETAKQAGHMTSVQTGRLAQSAGVKQLAITHYPHYGDIEQLVSEASDAFGKPVVRLSTRQVLEV